METSSKDNDLEYDVRRIIKGLHREQEHDPTLSDPELIEMISELKSRRAEWLDISEQPDARPSLREAGRELNDLLIKLPTYSNDTPWFIKKLRKFKYKRMQARRERERLEAERLQLQQGNRTELKNAFGDAFKAWKEMPPDEKEKINQSIGQLIAPQKILTTANVVVTYRTNIEHPLDLLGGLFSSENPAEEKLKEILAVHPDADLTKFESALGIKIVDVQRKGQQQQKKILPDEDNELGDIE